MERVLAQTLPPAASTLPEERVLAQMPPAASTLPEERVLAQMLPPAASTLPEALSPSSTVVSVEMECDSDFAESSVPGMYSWELSLV
jgi:hypothetical protein